MKNCYSFCSTLKGLALAAAIAVAAIACSSVDNNFGYELIPEDQRMVTRIDTLVGVKTYQAQPDSIPSSNTGMAYFGSTESEIYGRRTNGVLLQFYPGSLPYEGGLGIDPILDSVVIRMEVTDTDGDTNVEQTFDVFRVVKSLSPDSTYYTSFPVEEYVDLSQPLFSFTHKGNSGIEQKMTRTALGDLFLKEIMETDTATFNSDSLFGLKFQGIYIAPAASSPKKAATYGVDLAGANFNRIALYLRDHDSVDMSMIKDTILLALYTTDDRTYASGNSSVNSVTFDYSGTPVEPMLNDTLPASPTRATVYAVGGGGAMPYLRFTDEFVTRLRGLMEGYSAMSVSQARMLVHMSDWTTDNMDKALTRLIPYTNITSLSTIPDYSFTLEALGSSSAFDGTLNRSNGYYYMDVTSYVQRLVNGVTDTPRTLSLGGEIVCVRTDDQTSLPTAYTMLAPFGEVAIAGDGSDDPIEIIITYTLIK